MDAKRKRSTDFLHLSNKKNELISRQGDRGGMLKIHMKRQFMGLAALRVIFSKKQKTFGLGLWEYVYPISGLYHFSFCQVA